MVALSALLDLAGVELFKLRSRLVAWVALAMLLATPVLIELLLGLGYPRDAVLPRSAQILLNGAVLLLIALIPTTVSVMVLGRDYELGVARAFVGRGVKRHRFILSKVLATEAYCLLGGLAYAASALLTTGAAHVVLSDIPLADVAGAALLQRTLAAVGVVGLAGLVLAGAVNAALVAGRSSWIGVLAGLGYFLVDSMMYGLGNPGEGIYRYAVMYHAGSLLEHLAGFASPERALQPLTTYGLAEPGQSLAWLLLLGGGFTLVAILLFRRQDLMDKG